MRLLYLTIFFVSIAIFSCASKSTLHNSLFQDHFDPIHTASAAETPQKKSAQAEKPYAYHGKDMDVEEKKAEPIDYSKMKDVCVTIPEGSKKKIGNPYVVDGVTYYPLDSGDEFTETGVASWYGPGFHGNLTANGEVYDQKAMTAAHKTLPIPTLLRVENLDNGLVAVVRVNDRGPFSKGRIIDLSEAAASQIAMVDKGTANVKISVLSEDPNCYAIKGKEVDLDKGNFYVQIGAFSIKENADSMVQRLEDKSLMIKSETSDNVTWHRVWKTGYKSKTEAEDAVFSLLADYPGAFVIAK